jgi:hypothetical protein
MSAKKKRPMALVPEIPETAELSLEQPALPIPAVDANPPEGVPHASGGISDPLMALRLAFLQEKVTRLQAQLSGYNLLFEQRRAELEQVRFATLTKAQHDLSAVSAEYTATVKEIEKKHEIVMDHYTFDPDTGMLNLIADSKAKPTPESPGEGTTPPNVTVQ